MKLLKKLQERAKAYSKVEMRKKLKQLRKLLLNPRLLLCFFIAWMITNGWSYVLFAIGMLLKIHWMSMVGGAYMSFLWLPFTPEKILTVLLAITFLRLLYPKDQHTLGVLRARLQRLRRKSRPQNLKP